MNDTRLVSQIDYIDGAPTFLKKVYVFERVSVIPSCGVYGLSEILEFFYEKGTYSSKLINLVSSSRGGIWTVSLG